MHRHGDADIPRPCKSGAARDPVPPLRTHLRPESARAADARRPPRFAAFAGHQGSSLSAGTAIGRIHQAWQRAGTSRPYAPPRPPTTADSRDLQRGDPRRLGIRICSLWTRPKLPRCFLYLVVRWMGNPRRAPVVFRKQARLPEPVAPGAGGDGFEPTSRAVRTVPTRTACGRGGAPSRRSARLTATHAPFQTLAVHLRAPDAGTRVVPLGVPRKSLTGRLGFIPRNDR